MSVDSLLEMVAVVPFAMAFVVIVVGFARLPAAGRAAPAQLAATIGLALEFLLAVGLLRLSTIEDPWQLAAVGAIVLLRRLISAGLRFGAAAAAA